jgi:hypothetical protein
MQLLHAAGGRRRLGSVVALFVMLGLAAAAGQQRSSKHAAGHSGIDAGAVENGVYHNAALGFECVVPAGWVLETEQMATAPATTDGKALVLFSAFARTPHSEGAGVNASILIAAERQPSDPDVDTPLEYLVLLKEAAKQGGLELTQPPREIPAAHLWRADFASDPESSGPLQYQISEVMLARGYFVSFTFVADTQQGAENLLSNLHFITPRSTSPKKR